MASSSHAPVQKQYCAEIFLDKPIYNPGDSLNGQVILDLGRKLCCDTVSLQLYGSARVFFVQKFTKPGALVQSKAYEQEQILIDQTQDLWLTRNQNVQKKLSLEEITRRASSTAIRLPKSKEVGTPGLELGNHTFPFSFPIPQTGLHTSFDAKNSAGCIRYYVLLKVLNGSAVVLRKKLLFALVCPKILLNYPLPKADRVITQQHGFDKGNLSVELNLEKRVYVPGEPISGSITIDNKSGKSVKYASLHITQECICYSSRPEIQIHESTFSTAGMGLTVDKIINGDKLSYPIRFNIPALIPNIEVPNCIQTNYHIRLEVGFVRNSSKGVPINIKVPISIGTHLQNSDDRFPSAPPPYEDIENRENQIGIYPQFPPDYNSSILGLSTVENQDISDYTPLCYHYNFGYSHEEEGLDKKKTN